MSNKYIRAIIRHEKAVVEVNALTREIGNALSRCPITVEVSQIPQPERMGEIFDFKTNHPKTHLWRAFRVRERSSCGYFEVGLSEGGLSDALSCEGEFECEHCLLAYKLILSRKIARQELGNARRAIRGIGRAELAKIDQSKTIIK